MKVMFKKEYRAVVDQYNNLVYEASKLDRKILKINKDNNELEKLNTMKDRFYDICPIKYITMIEDFELNLNPFPDNIELDERETIEANNLFNKVWDFYGGYVQMSAEAKDQECESRVLK